MHIADTLSRAFLPNTGVDDESLNHVVHAINATDERKSEIQAKTAEDPILQQLIQMILNGWPNSIQQTPENIKI